MGVYLFLALLCSALPSRSFAPPSSRAARPAGRGAAIAIGSACVLITTFAGYLVVFGQAVAAVHPASAGPAFPIHFLNLSAGEVARGSAADALLALAGVEALALASLLATLRGLRAVYRRVLIVAVAAALATAALATSSADSGDVYFYAGLAMLGIHAFTPSAGAFPGDLRAINAIWGAPMLPSPYGPVWIAISSLFIAPFGSLAGKLLALKVAGLGSVIACALLARRLGAARTVVAAIACNPALYLVYVADAHNDLFAVDLVLAAMLAARRHAAFAFGLAIAAALVKLSVTPVALLATVALPSLRARAVFAAGVALTLVTAYAADDGLLWHALTAVAHAYRQPPLAAPETIVRSALVGVVLCSVAWTVATRGVRPQTAWTAATLGPFLLPQYLIWGLPLALASTSVAVTFLVTLPFVAFLQSPILPITSVLNVASVAFVLAVIGIAAFRLRPGWAALATRA